MKKLHLFLLKSFIGPFIITFLIAIFILLMQFLWKYIDDLVGKGLEFNEIFLLLFYASARFVPLALPMATLLSSVMVFGKLGENHELVALKSSGISFTRILLPLIVFVLFISYSSFLFSNYIMPIANLKNGAMIYNIQKKKPALNIKEGVFYKDIEGYVIKIGKKENDGKTLNDIMIYDHTEKNGNNKVIVANSGKMQLTKDEKYLELILYDGHSYFDMKEKKKKKAYRTIHFKKELIRFDLSSFNKTNNSENLYKGHYAMLNNKQLIKSIDSLEIRIKEKKQNINTNMLNKYKIPIQYEIEQEYLEENNTSYTKTQKEYNIAINKIRTLKSITKANKDELKYRNIIITKHKIEWHRKIMLAVACFIFFLIGAPLGSIIRKGGFGIPVLVSIFFFLLYHVFSMIGEKAAKDLSIQAYEGMWVTNLVFTPIAIFLLYQARNDNQLFDLSNLKLSIFTERKMK